MIKPCNQNNNLLRHSILTFTLSDPLAFFHTFYLNLEQSQLLDLYFLEINVKDIFDEGMTLYI